MVYLTEKRDLMNNLDGLRQELFRLAQLVDEAVKSASLRKLRAANREVVKFMDSHGVAF